MSNEKTRYQLLLERLGNNPALKEQALSATPEQFAATTVALSDYQLSAAAGGGFCECGIFGYFFCLG